MNPVDKIEIKPRAGWLFQDPMPALVRDPKVRPHGTAPVAVGDMPDDGGKNCAVSSRTHNQVWNREQALDTSSANMMGAEGVPALGGLWSASNVCAMPS